MRALEQRTGSEMSQRLEQVDADIEHLKELCRRTGILGDEP
jgi:hypothetical protein